MSEGTLLALHRAEIARLEAKVAQLERRNDRFADFLQQMRDNATRELDRLGPAARERPSFTRDVWRIAAMLVGEGDGSEQPARPETEHAGGAESG